MKIATPICLTYHPPNPPTPEEVVRKSKAFSPARPHWRSAKSDDLEMINRIADMIHVDLPERPEVFLEKLQLFPQGCFALLQNGAVVGYGVSHPWQLNNIPPLDTFLGALPASPECLFIHDVVVLPQARKFGASGELIKLLAGVARQQGVSFLALVSVYDTDPLRGIDLLTSASAAAATPYRITWLFYENALDQAAQSSRFIGRIIAHRNQSRS